MLPFVRNGSRAARTMREMEDAKDVMYLVPARLALVSFIPIGVSLSWRASAARNHHQHHFALLDRVLTDVFSLNHYRKLLF